MMAFQSTSPVQRLERFLELRLLSSFRETSGLSWYVSLSLDCSLSCSAFRELLTGMPESHSLS